MNKVNTIISIICCIVLSLSFAVIAYSQYETMKAEKVQAISCIMEQNNDLKSLANVIAYDLLMAGFSIEEIYTEIYRSQHLPAMAAPISK